VALQSLRQCGGLIEAWANMPVITGWYDSEESIYFWQFSGNWTWEEVAPLFAQSIVDQAAKPYRVDAIVDANHIPANVPDIITQARKLIQQTPPNYNLTVIITGDSLRMILEMVIDALRLMGRRNVLAVATSLDEALQIILDARARATGEHRAPETLSDS
jgi:hypothetical protein